MSDRGSTTILVAFLLGMVGLFGCALLWVQSTVIARVAAQTAADAAALAAAASTDPRAAAVTAAATNGARLVHCRCGNGPVFLVVVERPAGPLVVRAGARSERTDGILGG